MALALAASLSMPASAEDTTVKWLISVAVVATVFNDIFPLLPAGELSKDAFIYVFPLLMLHFLRRPKAIEAPLLLSLLAVALLSAMLIGIITNYSEIVAASFKGRSGTGRVVTQGISVCFGLVIALTFYNFATQGHLDAIARGARWALLTMGAVGFLELASWYSAPGLSQLYETLSTLIHAETNDYYPLRMRSTAFEASWAAVMLTFIFPFAIAGARRQMVPIYLCLVFTIVMLAQSRTAMLVFGSQILLLIYTYVWRRLDLLIYGITVVCLGLTLMMMSPALNEQASLKISNMIEYGSMDGPIVESGSDENISNITRFAAIRAGTEMFREHPLFGVGLGQYGFNYPGAIRAEDLRSWEVQSYVAGGDIELSWPPAYSIHVRLLAETGVIGYTIWLTLVMFPLLRSLRYANNDTFIGRMHFAVVLTLAGWLLLGASIDSFRFFGGWIALGIALSLPVREQP